MPPTVPFCLLWPLPPPLFGLFCPSAQYYTMHVLTLPKPSCSGIHFPVPVCTFLFQSTPSCSSLHLPVPVCTFLFQSAPSSSILHLPVPACTFLFQPAPSCSSLHLPVPLYTFLFQPAPSCTTLHLPVPACTFLFQSTTSCSILHPPVPACTFLFYPKPSCSSLHLVPFYNFLLHIAPSWFILQLFAFFCNLEQTFCTLLSLNHFLPCPLLHLPAPPSCTPTALARKFIKSLSLSLSETEIWFLLLQYIYDR